MLRRAVVTIALACSPLVARADPKPPTPAERAAAAAYTQSMARGRKATDAHDIATAIAAFDAAIAAKPHDARALAERGYAKLVGGDLTGAGTDLDRAASSTKDTKLLAQIWFNRGLIDEKSPATSANAKADFAMANKLSPSKAAAAKLAGSTCPLRIARAYQPGDDTVKPIEAADWLGIATADPYPTWDDTAAPKTASAAIAALFPEHGVPKLPALVTVGDGFYGKAMYFVVARGTGLHATPIAVASGGHCPGQLDFVVTETVGGVAHVRGSEILENGQERSCGDDHSPCTAANNDQFDGYVCVGGTPTERDLAIDVASGDVLLVAERPQPAGTVTATLAGRGFKVTGLGCDRVEPFGK